MPSCLTRYRTALTSRHRLAGSWYVVPPRSEVFPGHNELTGVFLLDSRSWVMNGMTRCEHVSWNTRL